MYTYTHTHTHTYIWRETLIKFEHACYISSFGHVVLYKYQNLTQITHLSHIHTHTYPIFPQVCSTESCPNINALLSSFSASSSDFFRYKLHPGFCIHFLEGNCFLKLTDQTFEARMSSTKFSTSVKTTFNLICRQFPTAKWTLRFHYRDQPVNIVW